MDKTIQQIINRAKKDRSVLAVAVFGSYARKEKYRDIDICVFLKPREYSELVISQKRVEYIPEDERYDVQIFQQLPLYIQKRILSEAQILYCKNEDELYDLYFACIRDFDHFEHIYEGYLKAVENG